MLKDDLLSLKSRVLSDFCHAMEFKAFAQLAFAFAVEHTECKTAPPGVTVGYSEFAHHLGLPDKSIDIGKLSSIFAGVSGRPFFALVHQQQIVLFEAAFFEIVRLLLLDEPKRLPGKRQVEYSVITSSVTHQEVVCHLIDRELNELKYKQVSEWFVYLEKLISGLGVNDHDIGMIAEAKATRDLLVHNSGIANKTYKQKAGAHARFLPGEEVAVDSNYTLKVWQLCAKVLVSLIDSAISKCAEEKATSSHQ